MVKGGEIGGAGRREALEGLQLPQIPDLDTIVGSGSQVVAVLRKVDRAYCSLGIGEACSNLAQKLLLLVYSR